MSGGNKQPLSSMRMRMDDYVPKSSKAPSHSKSKILIIENFDHFIFIISGNYIDHAVAKARREASTRTKDTFWTKKLLDAETSHPSR